MQQVGPAFLDFVWKLLYTRYLILSSETRSEIFATVVQVFGKYAIFGLKILHLFLLCHY